MYRNKKIQKLCVFIICLFAVFPFNAYAEYHSVGYKLNFVYEMKDSGDWMTNVSAAVPVGNKIFVAVGDRAYLLNQNGNVEKECKLPSFLDYNCRPILAGDIIVLPLADGDLTALKAETLHVLWHTEPVITVSDEGKKQYHAIQSTLGCYSDYIYAATVCFDSTYTAVRGEILCINPENGEFKWVFDNIGGGFYWSGFVFNNEKLIIPASNGKILVLNTSDGSLADSVTLPSAVNSEPIFYNGSLYIVTSDGVLNKLNVSDNGKTALVNSVKFAYSSTSTPVFSGDRAYIGGLFETSIDWANPANGIFCEIDLNSMQIVSSVKTVAEVKCKPLYVNGSVFFTCNNFPGALYAYSNGKVDGIYTPSEQYQNYCISTPVADMYGNIIFSNDSGALFSVSSVNVEKGDVDLSGKITSADARKALRISLRLETAPDYVKKIADMNNDGNVTTSDARVILRIALRLV